jgi:hypothetical protein
MILFAQSIAATLGVIAVLCCLDESFTVFVSLVIKAILLEIRKVPLRIKLELDLLSIKYNRGRHLRMAKELLKDINTKNE